MKLATDLVPKLFPWKLLEPHQPVCAIYSAEGVTRVYPPKPAGEIACPECGCAQGISYREEGLDLWGFICSGACAQKAPKPSLKTQVEIDMIHPEIMGVPRNLHDANLDGSYLVDRLRDGLKGWAANPRQVILLSGLSGRGKSWTAAATLDAYQRQGGRLGGWENCSRLVYKYQQECAERHNAYGLMNSLTRLKLLVLDDLGDKEPAPGFKDFLYTLIETRNTLDYGTLVTTNMNIEQMIAQYGDRIAKRLIAGYKIAFEGGDYRNYEENYTKTSWKE